MSISHVLPRLAQTVCAVVVCLSAGMSAAETIKIALPVPMTGPVSQYGDMIQAGAITAIEQINAAGGANGKQLELLPMDDACEPKQAVAVANKIISKGIQFVVGHACSGATIAASDIYENEGVLMVSPTATSPQLTELKPRHYIFRTTGRDDQQTLAAADYIAQKLKPKKVAILHDKQSYGQGLANSVRSRLQAAKVPVVLFEGINAGDSDYSAVITKLKAQGIDMVYFGGYHPEIGLLMRQAREQGVKAVFMGPEGAGNKNLSAIAGPAAEGMLFTQPADFASDPANTALIKAFRDKKRDPIGPFQMPTYTAVQVIADAMNATKSTDPTKLATYMRSHSFKTPIGVVEFTSKGDLKAFKFAVYTWHANGSSTLAP